MRLRRGAIVTSAGTLALVLLGGPMLARPARASGPTTVVQPGDTLTIIAARNGTTLARLVALNAIRNPDLILPGQVLVLDPQARSGSTRGSRGSGGRTASVTGIHVVSPGENLTQLAARYSTRVAVLVALNQLVDPNRIYVGQRLRLPGTSGSSRASAGAARITVHRVRAGETLTDIARRYGTSVAALVAVNQLRSANYIRIGQRLLIRAPVSARGGTQAGWSTDRLSTETRSRMARRAAVRNLIVREARRAGVPVPLALAVAWQESGWRQRVVSPAGAVGVMQLMPGTAAWIGDTITHARVHIHDPGSNVHAGVALLKHYLVRYRGDWRRALAAYYQGQGAVDRYGIFRVSRPYIASILFLEAMLQT